MVWAGTRGYGVYCHVCKSSFSLLFLIFLTQQPHHLPRRRPNKMEEVPVPEVQINGGATTATLNPSESHGSKRQRRPSVRLGDIGDQPSDSHPRRTTKPWRFGTSNYISGKPSKTRPLTNLTSVSDFDDTQGGEEDNIETNTDGVIIGSWKVKKGSKRPRSNWISSRINKGEEDLDNDNDDNLYQDFEGDNSGRSIHSSENLGDFDVRDRNEDGGRGSCGENGVKIWLNGLGLSRYAPVFQIHEVDDEVLPLLTLDDLKDMGVNAVGSRRKLYCAIQKLGKGFS
ncbi:Sterile alpha motif (SAM) domain-containing protein [Trifolium repens]|nr:Sterile alpha motif (SAM) domain-containing protein [Trifolium repens]